MEDAAEGSAADGAAATADAVSDFTEDLLEALTTDDEPLVDDSPAVVVPGAAGVELEQLPSFTNAESIAAIKQWADVLTDGNKNLACQAAEGIV